MTPCNVIVGSLSDDDLNALKNAAVEEQRRRLKEGIKNNKYPKPTELEYYQFCRGQQLRAVKAYERRTEQDFYISRKVMEYYCLGIYP